MSKAILWCRDHPLLVILVLGACSIFFAFQAQHIYIETSLDGFMIEGDPDKKFYDQTLDIFGNDNMTVVYVRDENIFSPEKLTAIEDAFYELQDIPGIHHADAIFNTTNFKGEDGTLTVNPLMEWVPETQEEINQARDDGLRSPIMNGTLIAPDAKGLAITLVLDPDKEDRNYYLRITDDVKQIIEPLSEKVDQVFQMGSGRIRSRMREHIVGHQSTLVPMAIGVLFVMLVVGIRTLNGAMLPIVTAGLSILWTLGGMAMMGVPINMLTSVVIPLIIVLGATEDMHLISEYLEGLSEGKNRLGAIEYLAGKAGLAICLTGITTFLGFLSITVNEITMLKQFGVAAAFGLFVNPIITFMATPVFLRLFGEKKLPKAWIQHANQGPGFLWSITNKLFQFGFHHRKILFGSLFLLVAVAVAGTSKIKLDNDMMGFFKKSSSIRIHNEQLHRELSGTQSFYLVIDGGKEGAFREPKNIQTLFAIKEFIKSENLFDSSISLADHIALINREMTDGSDESFRIPKSKELVAQYLLFTTRDDLERYVSPDYRWANMVVRHHLSSSSDLHEALSRLETFMVQTFGNDLDFQFTGEGILVNKAADTMAAGQAQSLCLILLIVFIIMSLLFVRLKAGLLALVPNVIPILGLFAVMGYFGIPLNTGTAMVAAIAIGIAVDDTIHLMVRYHQDMKRLNDQHAAAGIAVCAQARPVFVTSIALALGFSVLTFSQFVPLIQFGLLSATVMFFALFADLLVTPVLLSSTKLVTLWDMLGLKLKQTVIKGSELFQNMSPWQIKKVVLLCQMKEFEKGHVVVKQGVKERSMYLILEGGVRVERESEGGVRTVLDEFSDGETFGEIALVNEVERTANVITTAPTTVLEIDWKGLERIRKIFPRISTQFFLNVSKTLGHRLARTNDHLTQLQQQIV